MGKVLEKKANKENQCVDYAEDCQKETYHIRMIFFLSHHQKGENIPDEAK